MTRLTTFAAALAGLIATAGLCPEAVRAQRTISPDAAGTQRTISNVATIEWDVGATRMTRSSNRVDIVREAAPAAADSAATFRFANAGPASAAVASTRCGVGTAAQAVSFGPAWTDIAVGAMGLVATTSYEAGEPLVVVFDYAPGNLESAAADRVAIILRTADGDREALTLTETGADTGRFAGAVPTIGGSMPVVDDCRITVRAGATTQLSILDSSSTEIARAEVSYLIDPFGVVFDSGTGDPVAGVRVTLIDAATGRAADVFGDDGVSVYPSTVVTGQSITDAGGTRYDFPPGDYRFPLTRPGRYRLLVEPAAPYTAPSVVPASEFARFRRPDGEPYAIDGASYGGVFTLDAPAPVRIDVPIDAQAGVLAITKSASVAVAEPGDVVRYRITIRNRDPVRASGAVTLTDRLPPGFRLRAGSLRRDGAALDGRYAAGELTA